MRRVFILFIAMTPAVACTIDTTGVEEEFEGLLSGGYYDAASGQGDVEADTVDATAIDPAHASIGR
jgi:hypothetical protein